MSDPTTARAPTPAERLKAELVEERRQIRRAALFTGLTAVGLAVGILAVLIGRSANGVDTGWLADYVGVGGTAGALAIGGLLLAFLAGGIPASMKAVSVLVEERKLDIDLLMVLAAVAAALVGEARDGAILLFLFSLANTLEDYAFSTTKRAVAALMELKPDTATLVEEDGLREVPADGVAIGSLVLVRPGERVPLDGVLVKGTSSLDQSPITGESVPVDKVAGDTLFAGSVNGYGAIELRVTKAASESTLARMIDLVTEAQAGRSPSQRFSDWFGERYTVLVLLGTAVALGVFLLTGTEQHAAFYKAATLLVVASPCAIVISVPAAVLAALARAARMGVLFKGGGALEEFGAVNIVAFDKTGTLTEGRMRVTEVVPLATSAAEVLSLAAAIEASSEHPVAEAIVVAAAAAEAEGAGAGAGGAAATAAGGGEPAPERSVRDATAVPGMGIRATVDGKPHWAGNRKLAAELGVQLTADTERALALLESRGQTSIILGDERKVLGLVAVADTIRSTAADAIAELRAHGVKRIAMLTGDHPEVARNVARELGIAEADVYADLMPEEKVALVEEMSKSGKVAFVGDGVNDAAALVSASLGVAMGVAGSDVALEAADVALLSDDLSKLPQAHDLARKANGVIRQNLIFALGIMLVMVGITLFGNLPLPLGVLGHEGGTILVVSNGLRLLGYSPRRPRPQVVGAPAPQLSDA
ncbi:MAG: cation-translocating P-type ATPase [Trueperaceae bacterium]|nr:cation-translocating P-type ATPase [Truepera sp.]